MTNYKVLSRYVYLTIFGDGCVPIVKIGRSDYPVRRAKQLLSEHGFKAYHICALIWPATSEKSSNALEAYLIRRNRRYRLPEYGREYFSGIRPVVASYLECLHRGWCNGLIGHPDRMLMYKYGEIIEYSEKSHFKYMGVWAGISGYSLNTWSLGL